MITKVTKDNKGLYKTLFTQAGIALNQGPDAISSLDEYFACFKSLADLDAVFAVLPLDEPTFDIDANSREIAIPDAFKKNGISVQGDQIAEIVYFTIDRYVDTTDLYDDDINIVIQWETAAANGANRDQGVSLAIMKDITKLKDEGKMLFAWAINNKITENAGTIRFSVRFYRVQNNELVFSLSTLTQSAVINAGLDFTIDPVNSTFLDVEMCDDALMIKNRFKDSAYDGGADAAAEPVFDVDMVSHPDECNGHITIDGLERHLVDLDTTGEFLFTVQASSDDAGIITYEWYRRPLGGSVNALTGEPIYIETTDTIFDGSKIYYVADSANGTEAYKVRTFTPGTEIPEDEVLYEMFNAYTATATGDYWVIAKNRKGIATKTKDSLTVRIPGPEALTVTYPEGQANTILDDEGKATLSVTGDTAQVGDKITYTWTAPGIEAVEEANKVKGVASKLEIPAVAEDDLALFDKTYTVSAYASRNGDVTEAQAFTFRVTDEAHAPVVSPNGTQFDIKDGKESIDLSVAIDVKNIVCDSLTYQWYRVVGEFDYDEDLEVIPDPDTDLIYGTEGTAVYNKDTKVVSNIKTSVDAAGTYYVVVTNHVNGTSADKVSKVIRVSPV